MTANGKLAWEFIDITLGELEPWADNPKFSTKAQAVRLLEGWKALGQFQTIAIGTRNEAGKCPVYDGHQRLSALLTVYGPEYRIKALQSSRVLADEERRHLTLAANLAAGQWDWDRLVSWPALELTAWGFDKEQLAEWNQDAGNLRELLYSELPDINPVNYDLEWRGMPEFKQDDLKPLKSILVHFETQPDIDAFAELVGQMITVKTRSIWYPKHERENLKAFIAHAES